MSFSTDGSSREAIQALQFELWPDCKNACKFCYLTGTRRTTTVDEKRSNLKDALATLKNEELLKDYNAVGFIGGEFFQGQLHNVENDWYRLIEYTKTLLEAKKIRELWIATSLISPNFGDLHGTFGRFDYDKLEDDQRIILCTSFDTLGRFACDVELEDIPEEEIPAILEEKGFETIEELQDYLNLDPLGVAAWLDAIDELKEKYPKLIIHVEVILTQDVINKMIKNSDYFDFLTDKGYIVDFRYPSITRSDCPTVTGIKDYREKLLERREQFPENFFIESRSTFLKFIKIFKNKYGVSKVEDLIHQPEMRSRRLKIYVDDAEIEDRWNDTRDIYSDCGHLVDGKCYVDSDKCIYCDLERLLENEEII